MATPSSAWEGKPVGIEDEDEEEARMAAHPQRLSSPRLAGVRSLFRQRTHMEAAIHVHSHTGLHVDGVSPTVNVSLDVSGQHTVSWGSTLVAEDGSGELPSGRCNLYLYPAIVTGDGVTTVPENGALDILQRLIVAICTDSKCKALVEWGDIVGAMPVHALMVANTPAAIAACKAVYRANPALIGQVWTLDPPPLYPPCAPPPKRTTSAASASTLHSLRKPSHSSTSHSSSSSSSRKRARSPFTYLRAYSHVNLLILPIFN